MLEEVILEHSYPEVNVIFAPNPFQEFTTLLLERNDDCEYLYLRFTDITGKYIKTISGISGSEFVLRKGDLSAGMYFYTIHDGINRLSKGNIIIQ